MALILIMIILFSFPIIFLLLLLQKQRSVVRLPLCPSGIPIISNIHQFDTSNRALHLYNLSKQYDPIMSLRLSSIQTLVISSAKVAIEAFKTHDLNFSNRPIFLGPQALSYNYLDVALRRLTVTGER